MKLLMMKRSVVLAAVLAAFSSGVLAENTSKATKLSDAELDAITAGNAQVVIVNSGNAEVFKPKENKHGFHGVCVNCEAVSEFLPHTGPAFGVLTVENRGRVIFTQIIGRPHFAQPTF